MLLPVHLFSFSVNTSQLNDSCKVHWSCCGSRKGMHACLQMGGPEGVLAGEHVLMTVSPSKGMKMHAIPRRVVL